MVAGVGVRPASLAAGAGGQGGRWLAAPPRECQALPPGASRRGHPWAGWDGRLALPGSRPGARVGDAPDSRGRRVSQRRARGGGPRGQGRTPGGQGGGARRDPRGPAGSRAWGGGACGSQEFPLVCGDVHGDLREGQHCSRCKRALFRDSDSWGRQAP